MFELIVLSQFNSVCFNLGLVQHTLHICVCKNTDKGLIQSSVQLRRSARLISQKSGVLVVTCVETAITQLKSALECLPFVPLSVPTYTTEYKPLWAVDSKYQADKKTPFYRLLTGHKTEQLNYFQLVWSNLYTVLFQTHSRFYTLFIYNIPLIVNLIYVSMRHYLLFTKMTMQ